MSDFLEIVFYIAIVAIFLVFLQSKQEDCEAKGGTLIDGAGAYECVKLERAK